MAPLQIFIDTILPVFLIVSIGYVAKPTLKLESKSLSRAAYYFFVPAFVFNTISTASLDLKVTLNMVYFVILVHLFACIFAYVLAKLLRKEREKAAAYVMIAVFGNVGNFGLSIVVFHYGDFAREAATVYFLAILTLSFIVSVGVAEWTKTGGLRAVFSVLKTPALIAFIPAIPLASGYVEAPVFLMRFTGLLGDAMIPVMLFALGVQLAEAPKLTFDLDVIMASSVRLIVAPMTAFILVPIFGLQGMVGGAGIIQSAMPVAILTAIIAIEYNLQPIFVTTTVLFSTLASLISLTILLMLL